MSWLIAKKVPTVVIGASEPDPSWKQDEVFGGQIPHGTPLTAHCTLHATRWTIDATIDNSNSTWQS